MIMDDAQYLNIGLTITAFIVVANIIVFMLYPNVVKLFLKK